MKKSINHKYCRIGHTKSSMWIFDWDFVTLWSKKIKSCEFSAFSTTTFFFMTQRGSRTTQFIYEFENFDTTHISTSNREPTNITFFTQHAKVDLNGKNSDQDLQGRLIWNRADITPNSRFSCIMRLIPVCYRDWYQK